MRIFLNPELDIVAPRRRAAPIAGTVARVDYRNVFGPVRRLPFGSMAAYLPAQMIDVRLFHFWKRATGGRHLWLRNNGSTMLSQFVDTTTVNAIFLYRSPTVFSGTLEELTAIVVSVRFPNRSGSSAARAERGRLNACGPS